MPAAAQSRRPDPLPEAGKIPDAWMSEFGWRCIGPANMGGRITAITVYEADPCIWWAASASGGLLKTTNNGVTFTHQFDHEATVSIGDVQVAPSDANIVWVGTGEANPRNSVSWGDGVYKSTDGGATWKNMGLKDSFQIGSIAIHPTNPDIVYVGALGRLWGPNEERGLYKTTDGGKTWKRVLYIDDKTGVIDVKIHPGDPNIILAATYERMRDGFDGNDPVKKYGPGAGVYRSTDGGESFVRISQGLPSVNLGRIGFDFYAANPSLVYALVESEKIAQLPETFPNLPIRTADAEIGARVQQVPKDSAAEKAGLKVDDVVIAIDKTVVHDDAQLWQEIRRRKAGDKVELEISRNKKPVMIEIELEKVEQNGNNRGQVRNPFTGVLGGQAANLQDQQGESGVEYGGVYLSEDSGESWRRINTLNPRPMYYSQIRVNPVDNQYIYVLGTSMHDSKDGGKTFTEEGGRGTHPDNHAMWIDPRDPRHMILGNDGGLYVTYDRMENWDHLNHVAIGQFYHVGVDSRRDYWVYGGLQDNGSWGGPSRTGNGSGQVNTDWISVGGGDGFVCVVDPDNPDIVYTESQNGAMMRFDLKTGRRTGISPRGQGGVRYRFNWKSPFALSPQNSRIFYSVGNHVFRSLADGERIAAISPEITNTQDGSGSAIALSSLEPGLIYAGTTDGAVWMSKDDGQNWVPIYYVPEKKPESEGGDGKPADLGPTPMTAKELEGTWKGNLQNDRIPEAQRNVRVELKVDEAGNITGTYTSPRGASTIESGSYDPSTGKLTMEGKNERTTFKIEATAGAKSIQGSIASGPRGQMSFIVHRDPPPESAADATQAKSEAAENAATDKAETRSPALGFYQLEPAAGGIESFDLTDSSAEKPAGSVALENGMIKLSECYFDADAQNLRLYFGNREHDYELTGKIRGRYLAGNLDIDFGQAVEPVTAWRLPQKAIGQPIKSSELPGQWKGNVYASAIPENMSDFEIQLKESGPSGFGGTVTTRQGPFSINSGKLNESDGSLELKLSSDSTELTMQGRVVGDVIVGEIKSPNAAIPFKIYFSVDKVKAPEPAEASAGESPEVFTSRRSDSAVAKKVTSQRPSSRWHVNQDEGQQDESPQNESAEPRQDEANPNANEARGQRRRGRGQRPDRPQDPAESESAETPAQEPGQERAGGAENPADQTPDDPVAGTWRGELNRQNFRGGGGPSQFEIILKRDEKKNISGSVSMGRGDTQITSGSFDEATGQLKLFGENEFSTVEIDAKIEKSVMKGSMVMGGGRFTMEFEATRGNSANQLPKGKKLAELVPGPRWVSSLTASRFAPARVYLSLDGHRSNDDAAYAFASEDYGETWRSLTEKLPQTAGSVRVLREDLENPNLLFLGCEFSAWASIDRGQTWTKISGLPTVAVHEFAIHPSAGEVVAATHGRSLWICDITALRQLTEEMLKSGNHLLKPNSVVRWMREPSRGSIGNRSFSGENPSNEASLYYVINGNANQVELVISKVDGTKLKTLAGSTEKGLHRVDWDLSTGDSSGGGGRGRRFGPSVSTGTYLVDLLVDGAKVKTQVLEIVADPDSPNGITAEEFEAFDEWYFGEEAEEPIRD